MVLKKDNMIPTLCMIGNIRTNYLRRLAELEEQFTTLSLNNVTGPPENQIHSLTRLKPGSWCQIA